MVQSNIGSRRRRYGAHDTTAAEFTGRVETVGPEPKFVTGETPAYQSLGLTVTDARRGDVQVGSHADVDVLIVGGMPHVALGSRGLPALDPQMVVPGVLVVVWAEPSAGGWRAVEISTDGPSSRPSA
jgi:hypothetical protein